MAVLFIKKGKLLLIENPMTRELSGIEFKKEDIVKVTQEEDLEIFEILEDFFDKYTDENKDMRS